MNHPTRNDYEVRIKESGKCWTTYRVDLPLTRIRHIRDDHIRAPVGKQREPWEQVVDHATLRKLRDDGREDGRALLQLRDAIYDQLCTSAARPQAMYQDRRLVRTDLYEQTTTLVCHSGLCLIFARRATPQNRLSIRTAYFPRGCIPTAAPKRWCKVCKTLLLLHCRVDKARYFHPDSSDSRYHRDRKYGRDYLVNNTRFIKLGKWGFDPEQSPPVCTFDFPHWQAAEQCVAEPRSDRTVALRRRTRGGAHRPPSH